MKKNILISVLAVAIIVLGVVAYKNRSVENIDNQPSLGEIKNKTYINEQYGFSFDYPNSFEYSLGQLRLPGPASEAVPSAVLTRTIDVEHCGLSGLPEHCTDKTKNPEIKVAVVQGTALELAKEYSEAYGQLAATSIAGRQFSLVRAGVEGEGEMYYITALNATQALILSSNYIDENNVLNYKDKPGFLTLAEQEMLLIDLLETLKIK